MPEAAVVQYASRSAFPSASQLYEEDKPFPLVDSIILDSGATVYVVNNRTRFEKNYRKADTSDVCIAGSQTLPIAGWGSVYVNINRTIPKSNNKPEYIERKVVRLDNVAYIPSFYISVASLRLLMKKDIY